MSESLPLRYLGEYILDAGLSAILIMSKKEYPEELTYADWINCLEKIKDYYIQNVLKESINIAFTLNGYNNPSCKNGSREMKIEEIFSIAIHGKNKRLASKNPEPVPPDGELCAFYENEVADIYVARDRYPLLPERDNLNLTPNGEGYLAVSKWVLGCVLASIFVAPKIDNGLLYISTYDREMLLEIHKILYEKYILRQISIHKSGGDVNSFKVRHVPSRIYEIVNEVVAEKEENRLLYPIACYYISNDGRSPFAYIYRFPSNLVIFIKRVNTAKYKHEWQDFINSFYVYSSKTKNNDLTEQKQYETVNTAYDYMLKSKHYDTMKFVDGFIKGFFLKYILNKTKNYTNVEEIKSNINYRSIWDLLKLFIKTLFRGKYNSDMEEQIKVIERFAPKLADAVEKDVHKKLYKKILGYGGVDIDNYKQFTNFLVKVSKDYAEETGEYLLSMDDFIVLFTKSTKKYKMGWWTVRNLVIIKMIEELVKRGYFKYHKEEENSDSEYDVYDANDL
ncbi:MAG: hypothetical protein QXF12_00635 [Candidatus Aenigmatarchaeota archaeon]